MNKMTLLKTIIVVVFFAVMIAVVMSSCTATRGVGCPGQGSGLGFVGYK